MKFQKFFTAILAGTLFLFGAGAANALTISDVPSGYWAQGAIAQVLKNNYMEANNGKFRPDNAITRAEFANGIYKVINRQVNANGSVFSDINNQTQYGSSILSLNQLQIIFGYPDGSFKPQTPMKRSEASSVVANIVRSDLYNPDVLNKFKDKNDIPSWATPYYISNILNDIYVNYPHENELLPNEYLTRSEAAVLMLKLEKAIQNYKNAYLPSAEIEKLKAEAEKADRAVPVYVGTNTLGEFKYSYKKNVNLYDSKKIIEAGNIVPVKALQHVDARKVAEDEVLAYVSPKDIYSLEGNKLYDAGTKFIAYVDKTENSYWLKKQHKAYIVFNKAILTDGTEFPIAGVLYSMYNGKVVLEKKKDSVKVQRDANKKYSKRNAAIKFADKKLVPVIKYKEDTKDSLFMLITGDMIIPEGSSL